MGRLKEYRAQRKKALAAGRSEQQLRKLKKDPRAWCPSMEPGRVNEHGVPIPCGFQLFSTNGRRLDFCARCGWHK